MLRSFLRIDETGLVRLSMLFCLTFSVSCSRETVQEQDDEPMPVGVLMEDVISFQFAIYYLPNPTTEPLAELDSLLLNHERLAFQRTEAIDGQDTAPTVVARIEAEPLDVYAPPDPEMLQRFGRGLSADEAEALQETESVLILDWTYPKEHVWNGLRSALEITSSLARNTGGLIWDETTREVFAPDAWDERRVGKWTEEVPDVSQFTVVHAYRSDESVRAITLGMEKFGLPDVVIDGFSWSLSRNMGHVINLFAQAMAEGASPDIPGDFDLDFNGIRHPGVREPQVENLKPGGTGVALLSLQEGRWEEGDPLNRLIEITFNRGTGPDASSRQVQVLAQAFGLEDSLTRVEHDEAVEEASRRAREKLPDLREDFNSGLAPGELMMIKAPFATPEGEREWMWVEVTSWKGDSITGLLANEPFNIPTLTAGQVVEVPEADVFDYIRQHADGTVEGNETGKLFEQQ